VLFQIENGVEGVADATVARAIVVPGLLENTPDATAHLTWAVGVSSGTQFSTIYYVDAQDGTLRLKGERVYRLYRKIYDCTANPSSGACWSSLVGTNGYHHGRREGEASWGPNPYYNAYDVDVAYDVMERFTITSPCISGRTELMAWAVYQPGRTETRRTQQQRLATLISFGGRVQLVHFQ